MRIAFNPSTVAALTSPPDNKDITFDLRGHNIFARGVKFYGTDTNTWRDIKINNVSIGSHTLDLRNGSNTTLTNTNGVVTINSTQRPVVDNLTSNSTTSSLSANQGRVLAGLINGKSDSDHNHDGRYLKLTGGTLTGNLIGTSAMFSGRFYGGGDDEGIIIKPSPNGYAGLILGTHDGERSIFYFVKNKPFWRYSHGSDNLDIMHPKKSGTIALTSDIPTSLKNPASLNTFGVVYDGSAARTVTTSNFISQLEEGVSVVTDGTMFVTSWASDKGFADTNAVNVPYKRKAVHLWEYIKAKTDSLYATKSHNHDGRYVYNYGGTTMDGASLSKNALGMTITSGITGDWWHILQAAWNGEYRWNSQIAFPTQNRNGMYYRSGLNDNTKWGSWVKLLDVNNYSSTLDSRYYTESEVNSLLDAKLNRQNLSYGTWNPRSYNLAADYCYNGGDLSISESKGQIHVSIDGYFWQNEGQYRVLDTSDVAGLKGDLTVHQYLSATDAAWRPLIWGGSSHTNTGDSTGAVYKSHDKLSWQTSSQTLYATNIQTENIKHLSIGGGIYWNPYVESATDGSDAASITLVKSGVAGGTTLVLSQMNDANDTIQFKTNTAAKLYHNSYPILTTQNTYVNNHKGYIYGTEITQVNNADTLDGAHLIRYGNGTGIKQVYYFHTQGNNTSYIKLGTLNTVAVTGVGSSKVMFTVKGGINFGGTNESVYEVAASTRGSIQVTSTLVRGNRELKFGYVSTSSNVEIWMAYDGTFRGVTEVEVSSSVSFTLTMTETTTKPSGFVEGSYRILASTADNVASATKLQTPRSIWGQSFDGTANVDNTLRIRQTTGNYCEGIRIQTGDGKWATIILGATADSGTNANAWSIHRKSDNNFAISRNSSDGLNGLVMTPVGMGLGTTSPTQRLDVAGNIRTTGNLYISHATNNNMNHDTSNPRIVFSESGNQAVGLVYTDYDSYRHSKGLKVMDVDNSDPGNVWFEVQGYNYSSGYVKNGSNDNYVLLGGGGHKVESSLRVAYASTAGNAETLGGMPKNYGQAPFGTIPCIGNDGVMEIGRYIDYHYDNSGKYDFSTRLQATGNYKNVVSLPSASGTLALVSQVLTWKSQIIDMRSYSESYWHPVTVPLPYTGYNKIKVSVQLNSGDKPSWATHSDGITCNMEIWTTASGWGTTDSDTICLNYTYKFCSQNPCGWMQLDKSSLGVVFLRGGSRYTVYTDFDATFTPHNQKYTWSSGSYSQDTGGPYTSCPGLNFNMGAIRADLIATMVQARRVCAGHDPGIDNSISCSNWFRSSGNTGWYNTTYQGGWYMSDTSWIRAYNSVGIYTGGQIYSGSSIRMGSIRLERTNEINSSDNLFINYGSSTNVSLCNGGGNVGIGTISPTQKLDVNGNITTKGFGIQPCYLSELNLLPTISPGDGYKYKCLEIGRTTDISCIIADKAGLMSERGILIKFNKGYDGQIILLKDLQNYGIGNGYFWVMPSGCKIIKADGGTLIDQNQISNIYDDGRSRFLVYSSAYSIWIEFLCANIN